MRKFPITPEGHQRMVEELERLKHEDRPQIIVAIADARAHGDLSENAEYHSAREKQGFIEAKIGDLEARVSNADVIDVSKFDTDSVKFGAYVSIMDEETDEQITYRIVSDYEADMSKKYISSTSPVARALLGRGVKVSVEVSTPKGIKYYEILKIRY